jgi:hypothetical protein
LSAQRRQRGRAAGVVDSFTYSYWRISLRQTGTTSKKKKRPVNGEKLADSVEKLAIEEPKVKSKNLNVAEEFEKSGMKRMANFVVVGTYSSFVDGPKSVKPSARRYSIATQSELTSLRPC